MARVNHKLVKQRLNEKRSSITDRQFFSSRILAGHFEDIATAQTKRYKYNRRVRVNLYWNSKDGSVACTNNEFIRINCGNKFVTKTKGRENRYNIVAGLFAHELGHVLYTDFLGEQTHTNAFAGHYWYPATPILKSSSDKMNERAVWDYIAADEKNLEMVQFIVQHINNIIEDGYIENRMLANFPGTLKYGLECVRKKHFESMDTVTQMIEYEDNGDAHICESILQIILSYAKFGEIKYGDEPLTDERIKIVFSLLSDIDRALLGTSSKERFDVTNTILIRCWDYIHDYYNDLTEKVIKDDPDILVPKYHVDTGEKIYFSIGIFQYGLAAYDLYLTTHEDIYKNKLIACAGWAIENQQDNGGWVTFAYENPEHPYSSMAQGEGISMLIRAHIVTKDEQYICAAKKAKDFMLKPIDGGGTVRYHDGDIYLYECTHEPLIFNGWIFSLWGLYDYCKYMDDDSIKNTLNATLYSLKKKLPEFDIKYWSKYEDGKRICSPFYHKLHIAQLRVMYDLFGDEIYKEYADRWEEYQNSFWNRTGAFVVKTFQKVFER